MASRIPNGIEDVEHVFRVKLLADDLKLGLLTVIRLTV